MENINELHFYNMLAHIIHNNRLIEENLAIKKVWQKDDNIFLDVYFYRTKKSQVIDAVFIRDLFDLNTEKYYQNIKEFLKDYFSTPAKIEQEVEKTFIVDHRVLGELTTDLVIMIFLAKCCRCFSEIKSKTICEYITKNLPQTNNLSPQYLDSYLKELNPDVEDFYQALEDLKKKTPEQVDVLSKEAMKVCLSDGQIHYSEKLYLAEFIQSLREQGVEVYVGL